MPLYYASIEERKVLCACGHKRGNHHYIRLVGGNTGECLLRGCSCEIFEEN